VPDATQDVSPVGPGYPARPAGPTPGFSRRTPPPPAGPTPGFSRRTPPPAPARRRRGLWALLALAAVVILGAVVVFVAKPFSSGDKTVGSSQSLPPLALPGCSTQTARASQLSHVTSHMVAASGHPFDVAVTPGFAFVSGAGSGLSVMNTQKSVPVGMWDSAPLDHAQGEALTPDGHFLVVTGGSGITVFRVSDLEQRAGATAMGSLASPGQAHAEDVAITPDGRFAFVTFQNSASVGVFDLQRALSSGFGSGDVVGLIPVGPQPIGIAIPPDGQHAYVASQASTAGSGRLSVIDVRQAEQHPGASSVIKKVPAGCKPNRIAFSAGGQNLWVTAAGANALLGFSTAKLLSDPGHALLARVALGQSPLGLAVVSHGSRIVVADSNKEAQPGSTANLAVVSVSKALARKPALLGYVPSGLQPRQFGLSRGTLLVANTKSAQVQAVRVNSLP
jgi:DNA-binding beta-propeller fold protein YncE